MSMSFLRSSQSVLRVVCGLTRDAATFFRSLFSSRTALIAENLFLRKQLAFYQEHQVPPRGACIIAICTALPWEPERDRFTTIEQKKPKMFALHASFPKEIQNFPVTVSQSPEFFRVCT